MPRAPASPRSSPPLLTSRRLAEALGVSESSVKRWVDEGSIEAHKTAGGHRRIPLPAAVHYIRANRIIPSRPELLALPAADALGPIDLAAVDALDLALRDERPDEVRALLGGRYLAGASIATLSDALLGPIFNRIGDRWRDHEDGILVEHRAVIMCVHTLSELAMWIPRPAGEAPLAVTAGGPADPYQIAPLIASLVLRECGYSVRNLGPFTPPQTIALAVTRYKAHLAAVSIGVPFDPRHKAGWSTLASTLHDRGISLLLGGRCVTSLPAEVCRTAIIGASMGELAAFATGRRDALATRRRP